MIRTADLYCLSALARPQSQQADGAPRRGLRTRRTDRACPVLSDGDVRALEQWVRSAHRWAEASQALVTAATSLTVSSGDLADHLGRNGAPLTAGGGLALDRDALVENLGLLARTVEEEGREQRDRYLALAATIDQYRQLLD